MIGLDLFFGTALSPRITILGAPTWPHLDDMPTYLLSSCTPASVLKLLKHLTYFGIPKIGLLGTQKWLAFTPEHSARQDYLSRRRFQCRTYSCFEIYIQMCYSSLCYLLRKLFESGTVLSNCPAVYHSGFTDRWSETPSQKTITRGGLGGLVG